MPFSPNTMTMLPSGLYWGGARGIPQSHAAQDGINVVLCAAAKAVQKQATINPKTLPIHFEGNIIIAHLSNANDGVTRPFHS